MSTESKVRSSEVMLNELDMLIDTASNPIQFIDIEEDIFSEEVVCLD